MTSISKLNTQTSPHTNAGVAHSLRAIADEIESNALGDNVSVVLVLDSDTVHGLHPFGKDMTLTEVAGMLFLEASHIAERR